MDIRYIVGFMLGSVLAVPRVQGLQCPSCTYLTTSADMSSTLRSVVDKLLNAFQDPECANKLTKPIPEVEEETCREEAGKVSRCSFYKGQVTLKVPLIGTEIPLQMYQRGCYYSLPANVPRTGCYDRKNINENKNIVKQLLDQASSVFSSWDIAKFEGNQCFCTDTYCKDSISGGSQGAMLGPAFFFVQFIAVLFVF